VTRDMSQTEVFDVVSRVFQLQSDLTTADDGVDSGRAVSLVGDVIDWSFLEPTAGTARVAAWLNTRVSSAISRAQIAPGARSFFHVRPEVVTDGMTDADQADSMYEADSWVEFLSPVLVALSVATVAQIGRQVTQWFTSRNRSKKRGATKRLDRGSITNESVLSDHVADWVDDSDLDSAELLLSRAS
jgi:hypothetical protein